MKYNICPPSSMGIGSKFSKPILNEITIKNKVIPPKLSNIKLLAFLTIPIGPASSSCNVLFLNEFDK